MSESPRYERITAADVEVGDVIARTRNDDFGEVVAINEGAVARRFALTRVEDKTYPPSNWNPAGTTIPAGTDMGNIRPRRTAKLWRRVQS